MAKGITFDINIIETLYASLRQSQTMFEGVRENDTLGLGWTMWTTLLKTTQGVICLSPEMVGTPGGTTFEDGPYQ